MGEKAHLLGPDHALPKLPPVDSKTRSQHHSLSDVPQTIRLALPRLLFPLSRAGIPHCQKASSSVPSRAALACTAPSLQPSKAPALDKLTVERGQAAQS